MGASQQTESGLRTFTNLAGRPQADHHGKPAAVMRQWSGNDASRLNLQAMASNAHSFAADKDTAFLVRHTQLKRWKCRNVSATPAAGAAATLAALPRLAAA